MLGLLPSAELGSELRFLQRGAVVQGHLCVQVNE